MFSDDELRKIDQQQGFASHQNPSDSQGGDPLKSLVDLLLDLSMTQESEKPVFSESHSSEIEPESDAENFSKSSEDLSFPDQELHLPQTTSSESEQTEKIQSQSSRFSNEDWLPRLLPLLGKPPTNSVDVEFSVAEPETSFQVPLSSPTVSASDSINSGEPQSEVAPILASEDEKFDALLSLLNLVSDQSHDTSEVQENLEVDLSNQKTESSELNNPLEQLQELMFGSNITDDLENLKDQLLGSELPEVRNLVERITTQLRKIENQLYEPGQLTELLLPWIGEVLTLKVSQSKEDIIRAFTPIIDEVIFAKSQADRQAMSKAIADLIPEAIKQQIETSPKEIAQAIGPEMGAAIREQIKVDRNEIAQALAPTIGRAIKAQVALERDSLVDALYPVIGSTITRYLGEAIREINEKVSNAFSVEGMQRKIQSKVQGVSEAELILNEVSSFTVQAVFLIHKASGLIICEVQQVGNARLEAEMVAGMLTAIRSFVNDCIVQSGEISELNEVEYGDCKIIIEVAGYCYLAVITKGELPKNFIKRMRKIVTTLIVKYGQEIEDFNGDPDLVSDEIPCQLEALMRVAAKLKRQRSLLPLMVASLGLVSLIGVPWGWYQYRQTQLKHLETQVSQALATEPELAVYQLQVDAQPEKVILAGKLPQARLKEKANAIAQSIAPNSQIDNQIIAVKLSSDPIKAAAEVKRVATLLNQLSGISISASYHNSQVTLKGSVIKQEDVGRVTQAFEEIEGVDSVSSTLNLRPLPIGTRLYFKFKSAQVVPEDIKTKLLPISNYLKQYPDLKLRIVGYSPVQEKSRKKANLALERAQSVQMILEDLGIDRRRLETEGKTERPSGVAQNQEPWLSQIVLFEIISSHVDANTKSEL